MKSITITPGADKQILGILAKEPSGSLFRVAVQGGGCSGFKYIFSIDKNKKQEDHLFGHVIIDDKSLELINKSILDYEDNLISKSFKIKNPNVSSSCGCGISFSI
jgi:iron-sulfur cluster insertion protein